MPAVHKVQVKLPAQVGHHTLQVLFAQLHTARGAGQDRARSSGTACRQSEEDVESALFSVSGPLAHQVLLAQLQKLGQQVMTRAWWSLKIYMSSFDESGEAVSTMPLLGSALNPRKVRRAAMTPPSRPHFCKGFPTAPGDHKNP